jgi:tripartite-type tricarboxylate transporter receptor subunit TctC
MSEVLGQPVIVENKPGASGSIAAQSVLNAGADGYTLLGADNGILVYNSALDPKLPYKPLIDFSSVGLLVRFPLLIVGGPSNTFENASALMAAMKQRPGSINYATGGATSPHNIAMEMLKDKSKVDALAVHYRGGAPAIQDLLGGQIPLMVLDTASATPLLKARRIKPIASFSKGGIKSLPEVQSLVDLGFTDVEAFAWQGLVVPAKTPRDVTQVLSAALARVLGDAPTRAKLHEFGVEITPSTPAEMDTYLQSESAFWLDLIRRRNISVS